MARELLPRVVLTDVNLPGLNGLQLVQRIRKEVPGVRAVVLTAYDDDEQLYHAIRSGAHAYFSKEVSPGRIVEVVHQVSQVIGHQAKHKCDFLGLVFLKCRANDFHCRCPIHGYNFARFAVDMLAGFTDPIRIV